MILINLLYVFISILCSNNINLQRCFRWDVENEVKIRGIFDTRIGRAFSQKMYGVRKKAKKPNYMNDDAHNALTEYWSSDAFQEKSRKAKQNRAADTGGSITHFSGAKNRMRREEDLVSWMHFLFFNITCTH